MSWTWSGKLAEKLCAILDFYNLHKSVKYCIARLKKLNLEIHAFKVLQNMAATKECVINTMELAASVLAP